MLFTDNTTLSSLHLGFSCPGKMLLYTVQNISKNKCLIRIIWFLIILCIIYNFVLCVKVLSSYSLKRAYVTEYAVYYSNDIEFTALIEMLVRRASEQS